MAHVDHSEHSVQVVVTEWGAADLRAKDPMERAQTMVRCCAHPDFRDALLASLERTRRGHIPQDLAQSFAMHDRLEMSGDMHSGT